MAACLVVEVTPALVATSVALLQRHALRAADAIQLAACCELRERLKQAVRFVAFDRRLLAAARGEGLKTAPE
jgi:predicted nucleic acid-binding protein